MLKTALAAALLCVASFAMAGEVVIYHDKRGGIPYYFQHKVFEHNRRGEVVVASGDCFSTCTMLLYVDRLCITPTTVMGFHSSIPLQVGMTVREHNIELASFYQKYPAIQQWFLDVASRSLGIRRLGSLELQRLGVPLCGAENR